MSFLRPRVIKQDYTGDAALDRVQDEVAAKTRDADACPLTRGLRVTATLKPSTPQAVAHKLGRQPVGWIVIDLAGNFGPALRRTAWDTKTITLEHGGAADITVGLWVF